MSKVVLLKVDSYDETKVYEAIKQGIEMLGGIPAKAINKKYL